MKNKRISILIIVLFLFLLINFFSLTKIIMWYIDNKKTNQVIEKLQEITPITNEEISKDLNDEYENEKFLHVDFSNLLLQNREVVGWINVNGTNINYPFVKHNNNEYYLYHSFDQTRNDAGWLFLDYRNNISELDNNTIIYAHGRVDGTMLGSLKMTLQEEWLNNPNNYLIKMVTLDNSYIFEVFSIYHINTTNDYLYTKFNSEEEYKKFLIKIKDRSMHDFDTTVDTKDKIITLSTCYNNREKMVLHAKLVQKKIYY